MAQTPLVTLTSTYVVMPMDDVDTDQIIPARYLKGTVRDGLGQHLFADWRNGPDGKPKADFPLHRKDAQGARIMVAGRNFGCGSSREHAAWAITGSGFRAVLARSFSDIFKENAVKNGLLAAPVDDATYELLLAAKEADVFATVHVDLGEQAIHLPGGKKARFELDPFARTCLMDGVDELGFLLSHLDRIKAHEAARR